MSNHPAVQIISPPIRFDVEERQSAFIQRAELAAALAALALATGGETRDGIVLAAIAAGLKVVRQ